MTDDSAAAGKRSHGVSKFLSKNRWRDKVADVSSGSTTTTADPPGRGDKVRDFQLNDDVVDFLKPSTSRARPVSPKVPRIGIDVAAAQQWASSAAGSAAGNGLPTPSSLRKKDYPRRALRLAVQFTNEIPDVIGEGGDESEDPVIEISRRLEQSGRRQPRALQQSRQPPASAHTAQQSMQSTVHGAGVLGRNHMTNDPAQIEGLPRPPPIETHSQGRHNSYPHEEPDFVPNPIKRVATTYSGSSSIEQNVRPPADYSQTSMDSASVYSTNSSLGPHPVSDAQSNTSDAPRFKAALEESPLDVTVRLEDFHFGGKRNSLSSPILQEIAHKMRAEEGQTLHSAVEQDPFLDDLRDANRFSSSTTSSFKNPEPISNTARAPDSNSYTTTRHAPPATPTFQNLNVRPQVSQMSTPSPSQEFQGETSPDSQLRGSIPARKPIALPRPIDSQLRPNSQDGFNKASPRISPSLNVTIPHRAEYFQRPSGATSRSSSNADRRDHDSSAAYTSAPVAYTPYTASVARTPSNTTPGVALGQLAFDDFADRCSHMGGIFRLQAEFEKPVSDFSPSQWLRAASWWFLRGRAGVEELVRNPSHGPDGRQNSLPGQELLTQAHVDLAKTWWILTKVIPDHPKVQPSKTSDYGERSLEARTRGDQANAELFESCDILVTNLKGVLASMKRNFAMPPTHALIQGQDQTIWLNYPELSPMLHSVLSGHSGRSLREHSSLPHFDPLSVMAVTDTRTDFSYNRMFIRVALGDADATVEPLPMLCLVSVMRERNDWHPKLTLCTQKELVTICIQGDGRRGPSWQDVKWVEQRRLLHVMLPNNFWLDVPMSEGDYRQLYNLYNHTFRVQSSLLPQMNERIVYEVSLVDFLYKDSRQPPAFPPERIKRCRIRIFAHTESLMEGSGERKFYRGHRLLAVTSPKNRILGSASHDLGLRYPTLLAATQDSQNQGLPAMTLYAQGDRWQSNLLMVFNNDKDRQGLLDTLNGLVMDAGESEHAALHLKSMNIEPINQADALLTSPRNPFERLQWRDLFVVNKAPDTPASGNSASLTPADSLRIIAHSPEVTITDRVNVSRGELMLRLSPDGQPNITMFRQPQEDISIIVDPSKSPQHLANELADIQRTCYNLPTLHTYSFFTPEALHTFQASLTGFTVAYDGLAQGFTIARRRPVTALSKHKKLEAGVTRVQIVAHVRHRVVQLLAFFDDMPVNEALNFQLKSVDVIERCENKHAQGRGRYGVKMVDAKFTLPGWGARLEKEKRNSGGSDVVGSNAWDADKRFVNLDGLEPPAENDDITVGFEDEAEREKFLEALPAAPTPHRGLTIRRRI